MPLQGPDAIWDPRKEAEGALTRKAARVTLTGGPVRAAKRSLQGPDAIWGPVDAIWGPVRQQIAPLQPQGSRKAQTTPLTE